MPTTSLIDLYKQAKENNCSACKVRIYNLIAIYRNMVCTNGVGELGRGINIYIHPQGYEQKKFYVVAWVNEIKHTCDKSVYNTLAETLKLL